MIGVRFGPRLRLRILGGRVTRKAVNKMIYEQLADHAGLVGGHPTEPSLGVFEPRPKRNALGLEEPNPLGRAEDILVLVYDAGKQVAVITRMDVADLSLATRQAVERLLQECDANPPSSMN